jgi:hypothetical protein
MYMYLNDKWKIISDLQLQDEKKLRETENLYKDFETPEAASKM